MASKYLDNYLAWFLFVDSRSNVSTKQHIKDFLLTSFVFDNAMEPLFEKRSGWKRIYIDLPGMGFSKPQPSIQNSDDILDAILRL